MNTFTKAIVAAALCAGLVGCTGLPGKPPLVAECSKPDRKTGDRIGGPALIGMTYGMQSSAIPLDSVQYSNMDTAKSVALQTLYSQRTATNTVRVTARFISCRDEPVAMQLRTSFLDAAQAPAEEPSAWRTIVVQPRMTGTYSELSTATNVENYLIEIMPSN